MKIKFVPRSNSRKEDAGSASLLLLVKYFALGQDHGFGDAWLHKTGAGPGEDESDSIVRVVGPQGTGIKGDPVREGPVRPAA